MIARAAGLEAVPFTLRSIDRLILSGESQSRKQPNQAIMRGDELVDRREW